MPNVVNTPEEIADINNSIIVIICYYYNYIFRMFLADLVFFPFWKVP